MKTSRILRLMFKSKPTGVYSDREIRQQRGVKMPDNIYEEEDYEQHLRDWKKIHKHFKKYALIPALHFAKKWFIKRVDVPKHPWNDNLLIFDESFEQSINDWCMKYLYAGQPEQTPESKKKYEDMQTGDKNISVYALRTMKELVLKMCLKDTAYREFMNILMFNMAKKMNEFYNREDYPEGVGHLFYAQKDPFDVHYKILFKQVRQQLLMSMRDVQQTLVEADRRQKELDKKGEEQARPPV